MFLHRRHRNGGGEGERFSCGTFSFSYTNAVPSWAILRYSVVLGVEDRVVNVIGCGVVVLNAAQVCEDSLTCFALVVVFIA